MDRQPSHVPQKTNKSPQPLQGRENFKPLIFPFSLRISNENNLKATSNIPEQIGGVGTSSWMGFFQTFHAAGLRSSHA
ncbi:hypothetical protein Plhal304r1_c019g0069161 [Plasmopara halstedii]